MDHAHSTVEGTEKGRHIDESLIADPYADFEREVREFLVAEGVHQDRIQLSVPPQPEFGELASNAPFLLAKDRRQPPREIASSIADGFDASRSRLIESVEASPSGFVNFRVRYPEFLSHVIHGVESAGSLFGRLGNRPARRLLVEHTSVNPNKEWHVGHLRNAVIGDTLARAARHAGDLVEVQNYVDDTGRQAAEAVLALREYGAGEEPGGQKFDQYVGTYYVRLNAELETKDARAEGLERKLTEVLHEMEAGRHRDLVERILRAQLQTAARIGTGYDLLVWESDIVRAHLLDEALDLLKQSPRVLSPADGRYRGALVIQLEGKDSSVAEDDPERTMRVLVRSNGIPTYTGKDIPYMMWKFGLLQSRLNLCDFPSAVGTIRTSCPTGEPFHPAEPDEVINVVAEHQALQQQTVIEGLAAAGYAGQALRAQHLSYGMVSQAEGRISGRHGVGSSADDVLDEAAAVASTRILEKRPEIDEEERAKTAEAIAVGSLRYLMIQYSPVKPIVFDLQDVVSFEGNTGLYLQYALVRISSILRRADELEIRASDIAGGDLSLLTHPTERSLCLQLSRFTVALSDLLRTLGVNIAAEYAYDLADRFSQFYRDCPILQAEPETRLARLRLLRAVKQVMTNAVDVLGIPVVARL